MRLLKSEINQSLNLKADYNILCSLGENEFMIMENDNYDIAKKKKYELKSLKRKIKNHLRKYDERKKEKNIKINDC